MTEEALRVCIAVVSEDRYFADDRARAAEAAGGLPFEGAARAPMTIENGVATIPVEGPLVRKAAGVAQVSGLTSYDALRKDLRAAVADNAVRSIVWAFDSPGGEVSGLFELADEIAAARPRKPMLSDVAQANSAAYVLAAAVGNIQVEQAGQVGSIGVRMGVRKPGAEGDAIEFVSSVSPLKVADPTTQEGAATYQSQVDALGELLVEKVAAYRGVTADKVRADFGRGAVLVGAQAVEAGLADRVGTNQPDKRTTMNLSIFGLEANADEATINAAAQGYVRFQEQVLARVGATTAEEALGIVAAAVESHGKRAADLTRIAELEAQLTARDLRATLVAGLDGRRLSLGVITGALPELVAALDEDKGKAMADAFAALPEQTRDGVLEAACSVGLSAAAVRAIGAYARTATPVAAEPVVEPARSAQAEAEILDEIAQQVAKAAAEARGTFNRGTAAK